MGPSPSNTEVPGDGRKWGTGFYGFVGIRSAPEIDFALRPVRESGSKELKQEPSNRVHNKKDIRSMKMMYANVGTLVKEQETISLPPTASVQEAAEKMAEDRIGAILVQEFGHLKGIFTERDLVNRVVARGLQPQAVRLEEVMTKDPITVPSDTALVPSLRIMLEHKFRHLPVLENEHVLGVLSCRDIPTTYWNLFERWDSAQNELTAPSG